MVLIEERCDGFCIYNYNLVNKGKYVVPYKINGDYIHFKDFYGVHKIESINNISKCSMETFYSKETTYCGFTYLVQDKGILFKYTNGCNEWVSLVNDGKSPKFKFVNCNGYPLDIDYLVVPDPHECNKVMVIHVKEGFKNQSKEEIKDESKKEIKFTINNNTFTFLQSDRKFSFKIISDEVYFDY